MMKAYKPTLTASINRKGVLDIDTVKGCYHGVAACGSKGCYGLCYAAKVATFYGYDFASSVARKVEDSEPNQARLFDLPCEGGTKAIYNMVKSHTLAWFRIGTMGDPCHAWALTADACEWLGHLKTPIVITKHWEVMPDAVLARFEAAGVVVNTSISALDTTEQIRHRMAQHNRMRNAGIKAVLRIVSCEFGDTAEGRRMQEIQDALFDDECVIDNPLRIPATDERVLRGDVVVRKVRDMNREAMISVCNASTYIGCCDKCPDQCGVTVKSKRGAV